MTGFLLPEGQYVDINRLQELITATPHPVKPTQRLFLAVSMKATTKAFLLRYWRQNRTSAQTAIQRTEDTLGWVCEDAHNDTHQQVASIGSKDAWDNCNQRATTIHQESSGKSPTHTTIPSQVNYTSKERAIQKESLGAERLPHPKYEEATSTQLSGKGMPYHCDLNQNPFATSNGESRRQLEAILRRLLDTAWDIWRDRNGVQPDITQKPESDASLLQWLPYFMLPRPTSHQSVRRWLTAVI